MVPLGGGLQRLCCKCREFYPDAECRKISVTSFTCKLCGKVALNVGRAMGGYSFLNTMPDATKLDFWRRARMMSASGMRDLATTLQVEHVTTNSQTFRSGGDFLPLAVWEKQGYTLNMAEIRPEAYARDCRQCPNIRPPIIRNTISKNWTHCGSKVAGLAHVWPDASKPYHPMLAKNGRACLRLARGKQALPKGL